MLGNAGHDKQREYVRGGGVRWGMMLVSIK
jgi:hypothetical protein